MTTSFKKHWPVIAAVAVLYVVFAWVLVLSEGRTGGHVGYAVDDAYIHMAIAKHFARDGVWGVTPYSFSSSSSSLLWTLLLSFVYLVFGVNETAPLLLNLTSATALLILAYALLRQYVPSPLYMLCALLAVTFLTSLPVLIFTGMEHTLHAAITIAYVWLATRTLTADRHEGRQDAALLMLTPFVVMARYEGGFLVFAVCCLLSIKKRPAAAGLTGVVGLLPIVIYGLTSTGKGWYFLPNSIMQKAGLFTDPAANDETHLFSEFIGRFRAAPHMEWLVIGCLILMVYQLAKGRRFWEGRVVIPLLFTVTASMHMLLARTGWFYRYEAYLVAFGVLAVCIALPDYPYSGPSVKAYVTTACKGAVVLLMLVPLTDRGFKSLHETAQATKNIHEQQYQMGSFLKRYYQGSAVAASDIGAIDYLADIRLLDFWGLGSQDIGANLGAMKDRPDLLAEVAGRKNVAIAVGYRLMYFGGPPPQWTEVGKWTIRDNVVCGSDTVRFYAVDPAGKDRLIANLREFSARLPEDVMQGGIYTGPGEAGHG